MEQPKKINDSERYLYYSKLLNNSKLSEEVLFSDTATKDLNKDYISINHLDVDSLIEINEKIDVVIGTENVILIKRDMNEFYLYNRKVIYEIEEKRFIIKEYTSIWNEKHINNENNDLESRLNTLLDSKVYKKGM